jgi:alanine racemase
MTRGMNPPKTFTRSAWVEISLQSLRRNFELIFAEKPPGLHLIAVIKDNAYGHGAVEVAKVALARGCWGLAVSTLSEAWDLRTAGISHPILMLGERESMELEPCVEWDLHCLISNLTMARQLSRLALAQNKRCAIHLKVDTGMSRYGARWTDAAALASQILDLPGIHLAGILSHFAMSDELDKTFALHQLSRFQEVLTQLKSAGIAPRLRHICNSGGYLDLPQAHFDAVRMGILPLGVYPSKVCRRIPGLEPIMAVKARITSSKRIEQGDSVGYGMRYTAPGPRRIAVLGLGYGDGFPRVRNEGSVLVEGARAPIIGGVSMDAMAIDITDIPAAREGSEVVLLGKQGADVISMDEIAILKKSVSYDAMTAWRARLPRLYQAGST